MRYSRTCLCLPLWLFIPRLDDEFPHWDLPPHQVRWMPCGVETHYYSRTHLDPLLVVVLPHKITLLSNLLLTLLVNHLFTILVALPRMRVPITRTFSRFLYSWGSSISPGRLQLYLTPLSLIWRYVCQCVPDWTSSPTSGISLANAHRL